MSDPPPPARQDGMVVDIEAAGAVLRTPRAAAVAGILFGVLLITSLVLVRVAIPADPSDAGVWLTDSGHRRAVILALNLVPFAGIAFLWFIGVVRSRVGDREDRFFATVFLGSGLLFVAMLFVAAAVGGGLLAASGTTAELPGTTRGMHIDTWRMGRETTALVLNVYAMRMSAVFTISTATIGLRLGVLHRGLAISGYAVAAILLLTVGITPWVEVLFPAWVLVLSVTLLVAPPPEA